MGATMTMANAGAAADDADEQLVEALEERLFTKENEFLTLCSMYMELKRKYDALLRKGARGNNNNEKKGDN